MILLNSSDSRLSRFLPLLLLALILPFISLAQDKSISGDVHDKEGPLQGVIVTAKSADGKTLAYCVTDRDGKFSLSVSGVSSVEASLLGYKKVRLEPPFKESHRIMMEESKESLTASKVTSSAVEVKGDTITYDAARVKTREDRVLGDMLARLPGVEISNAGAVTYQGKKLNRLYINGKNVLDNDHSLATKHLDVNSVKSVSVYENHQPVKALRNSVRSETAAMNVELTDEARNRMMYEASGQAGYDGERFPYRFSGSAIKITGQFSSMNVLDLDASGHMNESGPEHVSAAPEGSDDHFSMSPFFTPSIGVSEIDRSLAIFNNSRAFKTKDKITVGEDVVLGVHFNYSKDAVSAVTGHSVKYSFPEMEMTEDVNRTVHGRTLAGGLDFEANKEKGYFRDDLGFCISKDGGSSAMSGSRSLDEDMSIDNIEFSNTMKFALSGKNARYLSGQIYTQYSEDNGIYSSSWGDLSQTYDRKALWNKISLKGFSREIRHLQFGLTPALTVYSGCLRGKAAGELPQETDYSLDNDISLTSVTPELSLGILYNYKKLSSTMIAKGMLRYYDFHGSDVSETYLRLSPMLYWSGEYESGYWTTNAWVMVTDTAPTETKFTNGYVITGYNSLHKGLSRPSVQPSTNGHLGLQYENPIKQVLAELSFDVSHQKMPLPERWLADGYVFSSDGETFVSHSSYGPAFYVSKSIFSLDAKIESRISYKHYDAVMMQNDLNYDYGGGIVDASLGFTVSPLRWLYLQSEATYHSNSVVMDNVPSTGSSLFHDSSDITFRISKKHSLKATGDYYFNKGEGSSKLFLLGATFSWELSKSFKLFLTGTNLMNATEFRNISVSPLMNSVEYINLRPRTVLLGLEWKR